MKLSVVIPVFHAEKVIDLLIEKIYKTVVELTDVFEIILVEDGSSDNSWEVIEKNCKNDDRIKGIKLSRNFGQQIAVSAGLRYVSGDIIVVMDGDLQNPPEAIKELYNKLNSDNKFDIIYCTSKKRNHWKDEFSSKVFWFFMNKILKVNIVPNQLMMKAFNKNFLDKFNSYNENIRVVAGITHDIGMRYDIIEVDNQRRIEGKGNYTFFKRFHLMLDIVMAMTNKPLNYLVNISILAIVISLISIFWNIINYILYPNMPAGYFTLLSFISFFGSTTLFVLGIIGRYLSNIYIEVRNRPMFFTKKTLNILS